MRKYLIPTLKIIVSVGLVIFLIAKLGLRDIYQQLQSVSLGWIFLALVIFTGSNILGAFQWFLLLKSKNIHLKFSHVLSYYFVGLFFNNFLIGYIGGDAFRIYDISKRTGDSSSAVSTVFFDRFMGFVMLTTLALFTGLIWRGVFQSSTVLLIVVIIFVVWVLSFLFIFNDFLAHQLGKIIRFIFPDKANGKIYDIYKNINSFKNNRRVLISVTLTSLVIQTIRVFVHYLAALSLGLQGQVKYFFLFIPVIALLASLPISIGGIGVRESSGLALFSRVTSFPPELIVVMEFLAYLIGLVSALPGGIIFMIRKERIRIDSH
ncbi:MAG: flippase-like domain-containing protein [Calditrichaeota bacterium]|nr:flippase-like domain-containing protein [Calditrichota bacterium]